ILAVATAHAKGRTRACHARRGHLRLLLVEAERIGEETGLWRGLARLLRLRAAKEEIEQTFGDSHARREGNRPCDRSGDNKHHAAPHALTIQLCTQRQLHPTQQQPPKRYARSALIHHKAGW